MIRVIERQCFFYDLFCKFQKMWDTLAKKKASSDVLAIVFLKDILFWKSSMYQWDIYETIVSVMNSSNQISVTNFRNELVTNDLNKVIN